MPQLPTAESLGVVTPQPDQRGASIPFAGAVGEAQARTGTAVSQLGGTIVDIHDDAAMAQAQASVWKAKDALDQKYKNDPDPATAAKRYEAELQGITDQAGGSIIQPHLRMQFQDMASRYIIGRGTEVIQNQADTTLRQQGAASTLQNLNDLNAQAARADDPGDAMGIHQTMARLMNSGVKQGYFSPEWAVEKSQAMDKDFAANWAAARNPADIAKLYTDGDYGKKTGTPLDLLEPAQIRTIAKQAQQQVAVKQAPSFARQFLDGGQASGGPGGDYAGKTAQVESGNGASSSNVYQFKGATAQQYGVTDASSRAEQDQAMARLTADNAVALNTSLGRKPSDAELYLAHQQGAGGAAALLQNPDKSALDVLTGVYKASGFTNPVETAQHAIVDNGGNPAMTAAQFAAFQENRFSSAGGPPPQPGTGSTPSLAQSAAASVNTYGQNWPDINDALAANQAQYPDNPDAVYAANRTTLAMYTQRDAILKRTETAITAAQNNYMHGIFAHYADPTQPAVDPNTIINDPTLKDHQQVVDSLLKLQSQYGKKDAAADEPKNVLDVYRRINLPAGDPNQITSIDPIIQGANAGLYSPEKADYLVKEFNDITNSQGESLPSVKASFLAARTADLKAVGPTPADGEKTALAYQEWVAQQTAEYRKAGKNPFDLFKPGTKDYIGSPAAMAMFQKTMAQRMDEQAAYDAAQNPQTAEQPGFFAQIGNWLGGSTEAAAAIPADLPKGTTAGRLKDGTPAFLVPGHGWVRASGGQ